MKMKIALGMIVLAIIGTSWYALSRPHVPATQDQIATSTSEASVATSTNPLAGIDLSSLEKDRLYTKKEGKYANLPEVGETFLRQIFMPARCANPSEAYCLSEEEGLANSSLIALYNGFALVASFNAKGSYYQVYSLSQEAYVGSSTLANNVLQSSTTIVFVSDKKLTYYKPGMNALQDVPGSRLVGSQTYAKSYGLLDEIEATFMTDNTIKLSVFDSSVTYTGPYGNPYNKKVGEKTFVIE
ncbi:MAG TPA: hypothetical protein ENJ75_02990 [Candidatus Kaiserbacteria bacterium]|nr:hypothetical protein [Candidatus Kaiserbacteria bacterium]